MTATPTVVELAQQFRRDGFLILRQVLHPAEVAALQEETLAQIEAGPQREPRSDFVSKARPDGSEVFFRIQFLCDKQLRNNSMLLALAPPRPAELVAEILGPDWTSYGSAMVFKQGGGGPAIELHRDTFLDRFFDPAHLFFSVDIYLDPATPETGNLKVIPGSHLRRDVTGDVALGLEHPELVDVPMEPGDILLHDAMLLHGSLPTPAGAPLRRVLYYSYQSAAWLEREGALPGLAVPRRWIAQFMKLVQHSVEERSRAPHLAGEEQIDYHVPSEWQAEVDATPLDLRPVAGGLPWEGRVSDRDGLRA